MRTAMLTVFLCATTLVAQETGAAKAAYDKLVAEHGAEMTAYRDRVKTLTESDAYKEAVAKRDNAAIMKLRETVKAPDAKAWSSRFLEAATPYAKTDAAIAFLVWAAQNGGPEGAAPAVERLVSDHITSGQLEDFSESLPMLGRILGPERGREIIDMVIEKNPNATVKANAHFARAQMSAPKRGETATPEVAAKREADLAKVVELAPHSIAALRAGAPKFEAERLQNGMTVPEIAGADLDGTAFKLSDYRGKVVVIDFWGDW